MHLSLPPWCAILSFTSAQQSTLTSTSASTALAIPWIPFTSTRSCTAQPSTVFVYNSDSTSSFLTHPATRNTLPSHGTELSSARNDTQSTDGGASANAAPSQLSTTSEAIHSTTVHFPLSSIEIESLVATEASVILLACGTGSFPSGVSFISSSRPQAGFSIGIGPRSRTTSSNSWTDPSSSVSETLSTPRTEIVPTASSDLSWRRACHCLLRHSWLFRAPLVLCHRQSQNLSSS